MEVTRNNFTETLPAIKRAIDKATFIAIDCEFTGLMGKNDSINLFDTQKEYYGKCRGSIRQFLVIQYGICCFRYDETAKNFKHEAYNFYTFARSCNKFTNDTIFSCQSSSIDFLINEGFDFNKLFKEGIPYLNLNEESKYKEALLEVQKNRANNITNSVASNQNKSNIVNIPTEDQPFIDSVFVKIENFLATTEDELELPKCNSFLRRLIYQTWEFHPQHDEYMLESRTLPDSKDRVLFVTRPKSTALKLEENRKKEEEEIEEFENTKGFAKVIRYIAESGKLVIGHNMMLDFLHTIDKFLTYLPQVYNEFKDMAQSLFPRILDTKYLCSTPALKEFIPSSVLPHVLETVSKEPFNNPEIEIEKNAHGYTVGSGEAHVAAYDAFTTGFCLIAIWKHLGTLQRCQPDKIFKDLELLKPFINKIHTMKLIDISCINLDGPDPIPSRDHVFYIRYPKEWKTSDLVQLFSPFGPINIGWIDNSSANVGLTKKENAAVALSTLSQSETYSIISYPRRLAQMQGLLYPQSPSRKHRKSGSSDSFPAQPSKKRKTNSFGEHSAGRKLSIEPISEEDEFTKPTLTEKSKEVIPIEKKARKRTLSKTFQEDSSWE